VKILAIDSATCACSAALMVDGVIKSRRFQVMERGQAEGLAPMVADVLAEAGETIPGLDLLAVTVGPGAFTGLRIGLAAARGYALASQVPLTGVTTLDAVAEGVDEPERRGRTLLVALDTKRDDFYVQTFSDQLAPLSDPAAVAAGDLQAIAGYGPLLIAGDAAARARDVLSGPHIDISTASPHPDAALVCAIAARRGAKEKDSPPPSPLYLRPPDAKVSPDGGRLRP